MELKRVHASTLLQHHLFSSFTEDELALLLKDAQLINLERDNLLFRQGEPAEHFYFLLDGMIKLYRVSPDGNEKVLELIGPHETFAEAIMFLDKKNYLVNAQALASSQLFSFSNKTYQQLLKNNSELAMALLGKLSIRLHQRINEIETLSLKNTTHRVVRYLIQSRTEQPEIDLPIPKRLIAARLSIQPETFSRIMRKLSDDNIIAVDGRQVTILDDERLLHYE
ncbi:Crp/Fnr family transcriptional regulator [Endozoicomonadaceae bacterium StTr2]